MAPPIPTIINCVSVLTLQNEMAVVRPAVSLPETEESWDTISRGLCRLTALCKGGACDYPRELTSALRELSPPIINALVSERSRLSGSAVDMVGAAAYGLNLAFEPLLPLLFPTILSLCARPNKLFVTRARTCILVIVEHTQLPGILHYLSDALKDKSVPLRLAAIESILACLNCFNPPDLEKEVRAREIESAIKSTVTDPSAEVRKAGRKVFETYKILFPSRVESFISPMTPTMKKYLDIKQNPVFDTCRPPSRPQSSQSSGSHHLDGQLLKHIPAATSTTSHTGKGSRCQPVEVHRMDSDGHGKDVLPPERLPIRPVHRLGASTARTRPVESSSSLRPLASSVTSGVSHRPKKDKVIDSAQTGAFALSGPVRRPLQMSSGDNAASVGPLRPLVPQRSLVIDVGKDRPLRPLNSGDSMANSNSNSGQNERDRIANGPRRVPKLDVRLNKGGERKNDAAHAIAPASQQMVPSAPPRPLGHANRIRRPDAVNAPDQIATAKAPVIKPAQKSKTSKAPDIESGPTSKSLRASVESRALTTASPMRESIPKKENLRTRSLTQPTLSQLSRIKVAVVEKARDSSRPTWGESKGSRTARTKPLGRVVKKPRNAKANDNTGSIANEHAHTKPENVPLPPSPDSNPQATHISMLPSHQCIDEAISVHNTGDSGSSCDRTSHEKESDHLEIIGPKDKSSLPVREMVKTTLDTAEALKGPWRANAQIAFSRDEAGSPNGTPISTLVSAIQRGFLFTPNTPRFRNEMPLESPLFDLSDDNTTPTPVPRLVIRTNGADMAPHHCS